MAEPTDEELDALNEAMRHLEASHDVASALAVGQVLLDRLYGGDYEAFASVSGHKTSSVTRFAERSGRAVATLTLRIRMVDLYPRLDAPYRDQITPSHYAELLTAPEIERNRFCRLAAMSGMSVRALHRAIHPDEVPEPQSRASRVERVLDQRDAFLADAERAARDPETAAAAIKHWEAVRALASDAIKACKKKPPHKASKAKSKKQD